MNESLPSGLLSVPAELLPEPGWESCAVAGVYRPEHNFVSGDPQGNRIRIAYWRRTADQRYVGKVWFGLDAEGPPLCAHGGSVAAVLDDLMGRGAWVAGHPVLAGSITVRFHARIPLGVVHLLETWLERAEGRKVLVEGRMHQPDGTLLASSQGTFIEISPGHFQEELKRLEAHGMPAHDPTLRHEP